MVASEGVESQHTEPINFCFRDFPVSHLNLLNKSNVINEKSHTGYVGLGRVQRVGLRGVGWVGVRSGRVGSNGLSWVGTG